MIRANHNRLVIVLCITAFVASVIGVASYVRHVESVNDQRAELTRRVCARQNQVIAVLAYLVSPERQKLVQGSARSTPSPALTLSNERIRSLVHIIRENPC